MGKKGCREAPSLDGSSLVHLDGQTFVDTATGMVLSRVGWVSPTTGYEIVILNGRSQNAHRLIAAAVHGPIADGLVINHLDGDRSNNHPSNLEVTTQSRNVQHSYDTGAHPRRRSGVYAHGRAPVESRLSTEQVARLRAARGKGAVPALAAEFGIAVSYAYQVRRKRSSCGITA